jgi:hypothetical protein
MADTPKRLVRTRHLAEHYSVSQAQIRDWFHESVIPGIQVGKTILFNPMECDEALERYKRHAKTTVAK